MSSPSSKGRVTRELIHLRACELALTNRRYFGRVSQADYQQAKMELTGERDTERQEAILTQDSLQSFGDPAAS
jgi:hypothetical protein